MADALKLPSISELEASIAHDEFASFVELTSNLRLEPWQQYICDRLQRLQHEQGQRILLHGPPQFGKSILTSQRYPAWMIGRNPNTRIRLACYNETHAESFTRVNLEIARDDQFRRIFPGFELSPITPASDWYTKVRYDKRDAQSSLKALGLGSGFVGLGADILLIDDPYKTRADAYSETIRENIWKWWTDVAKVRVMPEANIVVVFHRWHEDDLAGRLMQDGTWELMRFPALCDEGEDDPTFTQGMRVKGESLSKRYSIPHLTSLRDADQATFNGLFQGRPTADGGNLIKSWWWRYWYPADKPAPPPVSYTDENGDVQQAEQVPLPTEFDLQLQSWDTNFVDTESADWTVGQAWAKQQARKFFLDSVRDHADAAKCSDMILAFTKRHPQTTTKLVEAKAVGPKVIKDLQGRVEGLTPVYPEKRAGAGDKVSRVHAVLYTIRAGDCYLPHPTIAPWVNAFIGECAAFPAGAHDDQVDAMTQALDELVTRDWSAFVNSAVKAQEDDLPDVIVERWDPKAFARVHGLDDEEEFDA